MDLIPILLQKTFVKLLWDAGIPWGREKKNKFLATISFRKSLFWSTRKAVFQQ